MHVADVAEGGVFTIGAGRAVRVTVVALARAAAMGRAGMGPELVGKARAGDIRHCFADIGLAGEVLGYRPRRGFADSLPELAEWVRRQRAIDLVGQARRELESRGLVA